MICHAQRQAEGIFFSLLHCCLEVFGNYYDFVFQTPISIDTYRVYIIYMDSSIFICEEQEDPGKTSGRKRRWKEGCHHEVHKKFRISSSSSVSNPSTSSCLNLTSVISFTKDIFHLSSSLIGRYHAFLSLSALTYPSVPVVTCIRKKIKRSKVTKKFQSQLF